VIIFSAFSSISEYALLFSNFSFDVAVLFISIFNGLLDSSILLSSIFLYFFGVS
jgi:hypothetical protein